MHFLEKNLVVRIEVLRGRFRRATSSVRHTEMFGFQNRKLCRRYTEIGMIRTTSFLNAFKHFNISCSTEKLIFRQNPFRKGSLTRAKFRKQFSRQNNRTATPQLVAKRVSRIFSITPPPPGAVVMSKKRGLSLEEKREKMLEIFYDSQDFFLLKELEKMGPKKGVITQSVKDVVQSLVDDDLVSKDKIGTSVYFWSLPSCAGNQLRNVRNKLDSDLQSSKMRHAELVEQCEALKKGREESDEREEALADLKAIELKHNELKDELAQYRDNDPAAFEAMKEAIEVAHASANRWTDNIFTLRQWCSNNFPQAKEQLENMYREVGITDDFDYLELAPLPLKQVAD
ncbi:Meiotic nuclear division protein 1 [Stylosanthes scabra]|uniref:Meiotic nuclear division protein 1 n=1 Tax=Stylosanthes scabra TaxID=79078 RepID=A0ABU6Z8S4_9FABA|nr:Meiotic nuclear division protein 1 [Stylosanthes scabra]